MASEITDAYGHCGLKRFRPIEDVRRIMAKCGVTRANLVQHSGEYDNSYIEAIAAKEPAKFAGVFLVDLQKEDAPDEVTRLAKSGHFRGIRLPAESAVSKPEVWKRAAAHGLNVVTMGSPATYATFLANFARANPKSVLQITHLGQPDPKEAPHFASHRRIFELADHKNVVLQVSGMHQLGKAPYPDLVPLVAKLYEAFGPERLAWASNFPVMETDELYALEMELVRSGKLGVPAKAAPQLMNENARRIWFSR